MSRHRHDPITRAIKHGDYHPTPKKMTKSYCESRASSFVGKKFTMKPGGIFR